LAPGAVGELRDHRQHLGAVGPDAEVHAHGAHGRAVAHAEAGRHGAGAGAEVAERALAEDAGVHEHGAEELLPDREARLEVGLDEGRAAERARVEAAVADREGQAFAARVAHGLAVGEALAEVARRGAAAQGRVEDHAAAVAPPADDVGVDGQHARAQLVLAVAAHALRAAGVEARARVQQVEARAAEAARARRVADRAHEARAQVRGQGHAPEARGRPVVARLEHRAVVAEVAQRGRRRVLEREPPDGAAGGRERVVGPAGLGGEDERREAPRAAHGVDRVRVAHAEVDAEVHVARLHAVELEPVGQARRGVLGRGGA
jgi:hypothetical protein